MTSRPSSSSRAAAAPPMGVSTLVVVGPDALVAAFR
jgi:hypothetical protein